MRTDKTLKKVLLVIFLLGMFTAVLLINSTTVTNAIGPTVKKFYGTSGEDCMIFGRLKDCDAAGGSCNVLGFGVCVQNCFDCGCPWYFDEDNTDWTAAAKDSYELHAGRSADSIRLASSVQEECGAPTDPDHPLYGRTIYIDQAVPSVHDHKPIKLNGSIGNDYVKCCRDSSGTDCWAQMGTCKAYGEADNDLVYGSANADTMYGGEGDDYLQGNAGDDTIDGERHNDTIYGNAGHDTLEGYSGTDTIYGGTGNDTIWGGSGVDTIDGGEGVDYIYGESGEDSLMGGPDNDCLYGGSDYDEIWGNYADSDDGNCNYIDGGGDSDRCVCGCETWPPCSTGDVGRADDCGIEVRCALTSYCECPHS